MQPEDPQSYFDNPETWNPLVWQARKADHERARLAVEWLPGEVYSVLDVGCGNGIFSNILEANRFKVGLDLSRIALEQVSAPRLQANATRLPFIDDSFDATLSMEMLEHLPVPIYQSALNELVRVSRKYILITVPFNEILKYNSVVCPICQCAFHAYHHVRRYQRAGLATLFGPQLRLLRLEAIVRAEHKTFPALWNLIRIYNHRQGRNFPTGAICPQCGYSRKNIISAQQISHTNSGQHSLGHLWPQRTTFTWWMALYRKEA